MAVTEARRAYNAAYHEAHRADWRARAEARKADPEKAAHDRAVRARGAKRRRDALPPEALAEDRARITDRTWRARLLKRYGITPEDYDRMLAEQDGRCAVCGTDRPGGGRDGRWPVDHDHETGRVRGLLCHPCNRALGLLRDDPERLLAMVGYLRRWA